MANFLTTYLLHSTALLTALWLLMRFTRPRSPVLVERLWKLAAVLPMLTALLSMCGLPSNPSNTDTTTSLINPDERRDDPTPTPAVDATAAPAVPNSHDDPSFAEFTEPSPSTELPQEVAPFIHSVWGSLPYSVVIDEPTERRMGTPARPLDEVSIAGERGRSAHPTADRDSEVVSAEVVTADTAGFPVLVINESTAEVDVEARAKPERGESWRLSALQAASVVLPTWAVLGAAWLVIRSAWFRWRLRNARSVTRGRAVALLRELNVSDTRPVRLLIVPGFAEPAAFGIWRPTIVLPASCESLDRQALRAVLAHEFGHIERGDIWWLAIGRVLTTVLGFQPLNRIARREWTRAAECLCDDWAVGRGVERLTLARCLTALAEHRITGVSLADALAAVGSPSSLRARVERLVAEPVVDPWSRRSRRWLASGSVMAAGILMATLLPLPEVLTASVPRPSGTGLEVDDAPAGPLPDGRGTEVDDEFVTDIESELSALRTEMQQAMRLAEQSGDPFWIDAAESLRDREQRLVDRWQRWQFENDTKQQGRETEH